MSKSTRRHAAACIDLLSSMEFDADAAVAIQGLIDGFNVEVDLADVASETARKLAVSNRVLRSSIGEIRALVAELEEEVYRHG